MFYNAEKVMDGGGIGHICFRSGDLKVELAKTSREWNILHFPTVIQAAHLLYRDVPTSFSYDFNIDLYRKSKPKTDVLIAPPPKKSFTSIKRSS